MRQIMDNSQYRVEVPSGAPPFLASLTLVSRWFFFLFPQHLFTFELDGRQLRTVSDCVEQLQLLEEMGRVWGQSMLLEVQGSKLMLVDIETKVSAKVIRANGKPQRKSLEGQLGGTTLWCSQRFDVGTTMSGVRNKENSETPLQSQQTLLRTHNERNLSIKLNPSVQIVLPWRHLTQQTRVSSPGVSLDPFRISL